jgi:hypothetical protein
MSRIDGSFLKLEGKFTEIKEKILQGALGPKQILELTLEINQLSKTIDRLKNSGILNAAQFKSYSGQLDKLSIEKEIGSLKTLSALNSSKEQEDLKRRIMDLMNRYALSAEKRRELKALLVANKTDDVIMEQQSYHEIDKLSQKIIALKFHSDYDDAMKQKIVNNLFDMTFDVYEGNIKKFFENYNYLSPEIKAQLNLLLMEVNGDLTSLARDNETKQRKENQVAIARAVLGLAHDIAEAPLIDKIASDEEIESFIADLHYIRG